MPKTTQFLPGCGVDIAIFGCMPKWVIGIVLVLFTGTGFAEEEQPQAPMCPDSNGVSILRMSINKSLLDRRLTDVLSAAQPTIQNDLDRLEIPDVSIKPESPEDCGPGRTRPGYDKETKCLFVPPVLVDWQLPGVDYWEGYDQLEREEGVWNSIADSFLFSRPAYLNLFDLKMNELDIGNFRVDCRWENEKQFCDFTTELRSLDFETKLELRAADDSRLLFRTIEALKTRVESDFPKIAYITFSAEIFLGQTGRDAVKIVEDSFNFDFPDELATIPRATDFPGFEETLLVYAIDVLYRKYFLGSDFPIHGTLKQQAEYLVENFEDIADANEVYDEIKNRMRNDFAKVHFIWRLLGEKEDGIDVLGISESALWSALQPIVSKVLTEQIGKQIPLEKELVTFLPINKFNDAHWQNKYVSYYSDLIVLAHRLSRGLDGLTEWEELEENLKEVTKTFYKNRRFNAAIRVLQESASDRVHGNLEILIASLKKYDTELSVVSGRLGLYDSLPVDKKEAKRFTKKVEDLRKYKRRIIDGIQVLSDLEVKIANNLRTEEKEIRVKIVGFSQAAEQDKVNIEFSGCLPRVKKYPEKVDFSKRVPESKLKDYEFAFQIPYEILNEYLRELHGEGYFRICVGMFGRDCRAFENNWLVNFITPKQVRAPITPPYIKTGRKGRHHLMVDQFRFSEKIPFVGSGRFSAKVDVNQVIDQEGWLFENDSVDVKIIPEPELKIDVSEAAKNTENKVLSQMMRIGEFIRSLGSTIGLHLTKTVLFTGALEFYENRGLLSQAVNCGLESLPLFTIKEVKASEDGMINIYGDFKEIGEIEEMAKKVCK